MRPIRNDDGSPAADAGERGSDDVLHVRDQERRARQVERRAVDLADAQTQDVDRTTVELHLAGQLDRGRGEERLAGGVRRQERRAVVGQGPDVDHEARLVFPASEQGREQGGGHQGREDGEQAYVLGELLSRVGIDGLVRRPRDRVPGVVDQDLQVDVGDAASDRRERHRHRLRGVVVGIDALLRVSDEDAEISGRVPLLQFRFDALELRRVPAVEDDVEAARGQLVREPFPDTAARAGDQSPCRPPIFGLQVAV